MTAEIISVGTELLLGNILNTNAQYLSRELAALGITVHTRACISRSIGRLPSMEHVTIDPDAPSGLPLSIYSDGFSTSTSPSAFISNTPISLVEPNLFLTPLSILYDSYLSPSK